MSCKDNDEERIHTQSDNIEIMINDKADEFIEELFNHFFPGIKVGWKHQWTVLISYLIVFIYCIKIVINRISNVVDHIYILPIG